MSEVKVTTGDIQARKGAPDAVQGCRSLGRPRVRAGLIFGREKMSEILAKFSKIFDFHPTLLRE